MRYCFFDLETTGLAHSSDILEFGAVLCTPELKITEARNEYFRYYEQVPSGAVKVHGLTAEKLELLAQRDFYDAAEEIYDLVSSEDTILCGHNILGYDIPVLISNLSRAGYTLKDPSSRCIDTLKLSRAKLNGRCSLENAVATACQLCGVEPKTLDGFFKQLKITGIVEKGSSYHSALYDSFMSWCLYTLMKYGIS